MGAEAWEPAEVWQDSFRGAFSNGQPVVVSGVHTRLQLDWRPDGFLRHHGTLQAAASRK